MRANHSTSPSKVHAGGRGYRGVAWAVMLLFLASCFALVLPGPIHAGSVLVLTKTGPAEANVGDTITYTFTATHTDPYAPCLLNAKVTDPLFGVGWSKDLGTLSNGSPQTFTKDYTIKSDDPDPLVNNATLSGTMGGSPTSTTGSCTVDIKGDPKPGIQVSKTGPPDALVYETITYTVAIHNIGNVPLTNVFVSDSLVSSFYWDVGDLPVGGADYKHYTYHVTPNSPYPLKNVAFAFGRSDYGDVTDKSAWTVKATGLWASQFSNATTRNGYTTYFGSMNPGTEPANYSVTYHGTDGTAYTEGNIVPANARGTLNAGDTPDMPPGDYSAVIETDQPLVASQSTFGNWNDQIPGAYGANGVSPGDKFYMPNVCTRDGYHSYPAVQNVGDAPADVTVTYYGTGGDSYQQGANVPANSRFTFSAGDTPDMLPGDYSAVIESDKPIIASQSTFCNYQGQYPAAYGSSGVGELSAGTRVCLPNVCTQQGYQGFIAVQSVSDAPANVTATYTGTTGDSYQQSGTALPYSRLTFDAHGTPDMPPGDYSLVLESDQPIVASQSTFGDFQGEGVVAYGTNGTLDPGTGFYLPNLSSRPGYRGYIAVLNTGDASATVNVTFHGAQGQTWSQTITVGPGARGTIAVHSTPDMPAGDYSAVIESDQPVVVSQSTIGDYQGMGNRAYGTSGIPR